MKERVALPNKKAAENSHYKELTKIARGAGIIFIGKILEGGLIYISLIVIAKILGAQYFGLFVLGLTVIKFSGILSRLGLDNGVLHYVSLYNGVGDKERVKGVIIQSLKYSFIASIIAGGLLFFTATIISTKVFHKPDLTNIIKLFSVSLPFISIMELALSSTRGFQIMKYTVYVKSIFRPTIYLVLITVLFFAGLKLLGVVAAYVVSMALGMVLSFCYLEKAFPLIKGKVKATFETGKLFRFSVPLFLVSFLGFLIMWTDTLMLGYFRSSSEVGAYNAAARTALLITFILMAFNSIFAPMISDLYNRGEMEKLSSLFKNVTKWIFALSFPAFLIMTLMSKEILSFFGPEFVAARTVLIILAFAQFVNAGAGSVGYMLMMSERQNVEMYNTLGIFTSNIILNIVLIPKYGILGAAIATGLSVIFINLIRLAEVYAFLRIHPYNTKYLKILLSGTIATVIIFIFKNLIFNYGYIISLISSIPLFLFSFLGVLALLGFDEEDKMILGLLRRRVLKV